MALFGRKTPKSTPKTSITDRSVIVFDLRKYRVIGEYNYVDYRGETKTIQHLIDVESGLHHLKEDEKLSIGYAEIEYLGCDRKFKGKDLEKDEYYLITGTHQEPGSYKRIDKWLSHSLYTTLVSSSPICIEAGTIGPTQATSKQAKFADMYIAEPRNANYKRHIGPYTDMYCSEGKVVYKDQDGNVFQGLPDGRVMGGDDYYTGIAASEYARTYIKFEEDYEALKKKRYGESRMLSLSETFGAMKEILSDIPEDVYEINIFVDYIMDLISSEFNKRLDFVDNVRLEEIQRYTDDITKICVTKRQNCIDRQRAEFEENEYIRQRKELVASRFEGAKGEVIGMKIPQNRGDMLVETIRERNQKGGE